MRLLPALRCPSLATTSVTHHTPHLHNSSYHPTSHSPGNTSKESADASADASGDGSIKGTAATTSKPDDEADATNVDTNEKCYWKDNGFKSKTFDTKGKALKHLSEDLQDALDNLAKVTLNSGTATTFGGKGGNGESLLLQMSNPIRFSVQTDTAVSLKEQTGRFGDKLARSAYGSDEEYLTACKASCAADVACRKWVRSHTNYYERRCVQGGCKGFRDDPTGSRGRKCKPHGMPWDEAVRAVSSSRGRTRWSGQTLYVLCGAALLSRDRTSLRDNEWCKGDRGSGGAGGAAGPPGPNGADGPKGLDGHKGSKGSKGEGGNNGAGGEVGAPGPQGLQGPHGANGASPVAKTGSPGVRGAQGTAGMRGETGKAGKTGKPGLPGCKFVRTFTSPDSSTPSP